MRSISCFGVWMPCSCFGFLKGMKNKNNFRKSNSMNGSVSTAVVIVNNFQHTGTLEAR